MQALLEARELSLRFSNGRLGLDRVSLSLGPGEFVVVAGRNGSGKTLLLRTLVGLERPTSGGVFFRGLPLRGRLGEARRTIGVVFQDADTQIIGATVEDDLRFGLDNAAAAGRATTDETTIGTRARACAERLGLSMVLDVPAQDLSGGEKRRLSIGGVLVLEPELLILDEPFANLDFAGVVSVLSLLVRLRRDGHGIVVITHELEKLLAHAERLVIMEGGAIREDGPPRTVARRAGTYGLHPLDFSRIPLEECTWLV